MTSKPIAYDQARNTLGPKEKIGQLFMPAAFINDSEEEIQKLELLIQEQCIGSICFFHSRASAATNFEGKKQVEFNTKSFEVLKQRIVRYQKAAKYPLLIAIDAEWGLAMRIENTPQYPYAISLGAIQDGPELIFEVGKHIANDCKAAGIHWNLAPVVDINNNKNNPVIGYRSFGEDRSLVTKKASAFNKGTQSEGVLTSIKHFPGHGDTATDSHLGLPLIEKSKETLVANELYPFQELIKEGVDSVMIGHLSVPSLADGKKTPSSICKKIITGLLRTEMGYDGVVISDALNMHAVAQQYPVKGQLEWLAFDAGNDVLCFAEHIAEGIETIARNASNAQIENAFARVWKLKEKAFSNIPKVAPQLSDGTLLNRKIALHSLTMIKGTETILQRFRETAFKVFGNIPNANNGFLNAIGAGQSINVLKKDSEMAPDLPVAEKGQPMVLALFPPQVKPNNTFGFTENELNDINTLILENDVVLYLFGNPYCLEHIAFERTKVTVVAYQRFETFQEHAAQHFLGKAKALGKLPIQL